MPLRQLAINSRSTGRYWESEINGRPHVLTTMVSIEGDSVMNSLFYPAAEVRQAHGQLDRLPAPASHPVVNGVFVSAYDPLAVNAHNVGGIVLNPRMDGNQVINDLAFDVEVAERDDRGKEILNRIKSGERIGVSTGGRANITNQAGVAGGKSYRGTVHGLEFDHVAVLLDEEPAGEGTFTLNAEATGILLCNVDTSVNALREELQSAATLKWGNGAWVEDIFTDSSRVIVETTNGDDRRMLSVPFSRDPTGTVVFDGEGDIVARKVVYEPIGQPDPETSDMDKAKMILALIGNANTPFTAADAARLEAMSELELANAICQPVSLERATAIVLESGQALVNAEAFDQEGYADYVANKAAFDAFKAAQAEERKALVERIVANSKSTADDLAELSDDALQRMAESLTPKPDYSGAGAPITNAETGEAVTVDYS